MCCTCIGRRTTYCADPIFSTSRNICILFTQNLFSFINPTVFILISLCVLFFTLKLIQLVLNSKSYKRIRLSPFTKILFECHEIFYHTINTTKYNTHNNHFYFSRIIFMKSILPPYLYLTLYFISPTTRLIQSTI